MLRIPGMPALVGMSLLGFTSFFLTLSALPVYAVDRGVPEALAGLVTTVMLMATVTAQLVVPTAVEKIGQRATLIIGLLALDRVHPRLGHSRGQRVRLQVRRVVELAQRLMHPLREFCLLRFG